MIRVPLLQEPARAEHSSAGRARRFRYNPRAFREVDGAIPPAAA